LGRLRRIGRSFGREFANVTGSRICENSDFTQVSLSETDPGVSANCYHAGQSG
jgi:hypothetical protein